MSADTAADTGAHIPGRGYETGCRCPGCTATHRDRCRAVREAVQAERVMTDGRLIHPRAPHGTVRAYTWWGCRCEPCTAANSAYSAQRRARGSW